MISGMTIDELAAHFGGPRFRAVQLFEWIHGKQVDRVGEMTNLPKSFRDEVAREKFPTIAYAKEQVSEDGQTIKYLFELEDGKKVESVLILAPERRTICISCQVGCPARCAFCASGKKGLLRNLTPAEIVEQVLWIQKRRGEKITNLVFMGMGEPMANYEAVVKAIRLFKDPKGLALSGRRITISTVGYVEGIDRLAEEDLGVNLVLSLHAPNQNLRKKIIPTARDYPLEEILLAMDRFAAATKRDITYEYTLLDEINDQPEHADALASLLFGKQCTVNLIPYNPVDGLHLRRPSGEKIEAFRYILESKGIRTTWRYTKGKDIQAACGQLALVDTMS
jgi:23S rRNA (adenine2503-C2)-methyltransferase